LRDFAKPFISFCADIISKLAGLESGSLDDITKFFSDMDLPVDDMVQQFSGVHQAVKGSVSYFGAEHLMLLSCRGVNSGVLRVTSEQDQSMLQGIVKGAVSDCGDEHLMLSACRGVNTLFAILLKKIISGGRIIYRFCERSDLAFSILMCPYFGGYYSVPLKVKKLLQGLVPEIVPFPMIYNSYICFNYFTH
jgi:hypothetical protein